MPFLFFYVTLDRNGEKKKKRKKKWRIKNQTKNHELSQSSIWFPSPCLQQFLSSSELLTRASCRKDWKKISAESSFMSTRRPNRSRDWTELTKLSSCTAEASCCWKLHFRFRPDFIWLWVDFIRPRRANFYITDALKPWELIRPRVRF